MPQLAVTLVALLLQAPNRGAPQEPAREGAKPVPAAGDLSEHFETGKGLRVTRWAESPQLFNPTAIDVDARGRIWVAEAVNYRRWRGRNPGLSFPEGDRIVILEDTDGDGTCDSTKVFAQDTDLVAPLGIAVFGERVVVSCSPTAWVYTDADGDDVPERKEPLLTGFGGRDHDHGLHSFVGGPDGAWWFSVGNAGPHVVTDKLGWTLRSGSIYRDGGAEPADNVPGLVSDDGRVWTGGLMLRVLPDGSELSVRAHNFRNQYEVALDSFGNPFTADNDDEVVTCRTLWCMEAGNHGFFSADGSRTWQADRRPGQTTFEAHWHADDPGVVPPGTCNGSGGPTGVVVYEGMLLPAYHGAVLNADAGARVVYAHTPVASGAGYELKPGVFLKPREDGGRDAEHDDGAQRFRPSDVAVGLDGSVYVADWYDPGVGGHAMADEVGYGRILRIAPAAARGGNPRIGFAPIEAALSALCSPAVNVRWRGFEALAGQGELAVPRLKTFVKTAGPRFAARALWLLALANEEGRATVREFLSHENEDLRVTAFRALRAAGQDVGELAKFALSSDSLALRRELAIALRELPWERRAELLQKATTPWPGDRFFLEAIGIGASGHERELLEAVIAASKGDADRARELELAWRLGTVAALPVLRSEIEHGETPESRRRALDGLAFVRGREAAETMLQLALAGPPELRDRAAWWIRFRDTNDWREHRLAGQLGDVDREHARKAWSSGPMKSGLARFAVDLAGARHVLLRVSPGTNGIDYDWADWIEGRFEGGGRSWKLSELGWARASCGWGSVQVGRDCEGGEIEIDGTRFEDGIGTHAESEIVFRVPDGAERLAGACGPDDGGAKRSGTRCEVEFEILLDVPPDRRAFDAALERVTGSDASARGPAASELASSREGAFALLHLAEEGRLDAEVRSAVGRALLEHADPAVRALAAACFRRDARSERSLDALLALAGDRRRGERAFFGSQAQCSQCHAVRGRGGAVGPDLSEIRRKYGARDLLDHVLHPNKAIEHGFQIWRIETTDGRIHTGFVRAGDPLARGGGVVVLEGTDGTREAFEEADVELARRQEISVMPDDVSLGLTDQDLADMAAFLLDDPDAPPKQGEPIRMFDGGDLSRWEFFLEDPKLRLEDVWSVRGGALRCAGTPAGYLKTRERFESFVLELEWRWPAEPGNSGVLLRVADRDEIWPRSVEAQLMHGRAGDLWNIGRFPMLVDPARTDGRRTARFAPSNEKPAGEWNRYRITLRRGDLAVEVNGVLQNRASWCEEVAGRIALQSEGAPIEFRDVVVVPLLD